MVLIYQKEWVCRLASKTLHLMFWAQQMLWFVTCTVNSADWQIFPPCACRALMKGLTHIHKHMHIQQINKSDEEYVWYFTRSDFLFASRQLPDFWRTLSVIFLFLGFPSCESGFVKSLLFNLFVYIWYTLLQVCPYWKSVWGSYICCCAFLHFGNNFKA